MEIHHQFDLQFAVDTTAASHLVRIPLRQDEKLIMKTRENWSLGKQLLGTRK